MALDNTLDFKEINALLQILNTQVTALQSNTDIDQKAAARAKQLIIASCTHLIHSIQSPIEVINESTGGIFKTVVLGFVVDVDIPEVVRDFGKPEQGGGVHVDEISRMVGIDASYIARILRYLATRHIFVELSPNVFAHNRISTILCKPRPWKEIKAEWHLMYSPISRFDDAPFAAFVSMLAEEPVIETLSSFSPFVKLQRPNNANTTESSSIEEASAPAPKTAFNYKFSTPQSIWSWLASQSANDDPEEKEKYEMRKRKVAALMKGGDVINEGGNQENGGVLVDGIKTALALENSDNFKSTRIVDVGGSTGSATLVLKKYFDKTKTGSSQASTKYIVQDLERGIETAQKFWEEKDSKAIESGEVELVVHDFFTPQPQSPASSETTTVYFLRMIVHDWPDNEAKVILKRLREAHAGTTESRLVIFDSLARYTCDDPSLSGREKEGQRPLLGNLGVAGEGHSTMMDLAMMAYHNGKERTREEFELLGKETGWKLERIVEGKPVAGLVFSAL
ncbi:hypothetical protein VKT23_012175 [Stygiomarasmius scandens]|uniref:O-methyltransferase C-terminal domain-containing protein n=1 Tax=Marasmiellus scandens TaxID=2682957 RepID=A0ABR1J746_9AGAR